MKKFIVVVISILFAKGTMSQTINYKYDSLSRLTQVIYPDSSIIKYTYDAACNRISKKVIQSKYTLDQNKAPTIVIDSPANNATYKAPATITLNAIATDPDGTITSVQFFNGSALLTTDSISPYSCTINNLTPGNYSFVAKATDNNGLSSNSATVAVSVLLPPNKAPFVNITDPVNNANYIHPASITINAIASDTDGTITNVKFYKDSTLLGIDSTSPYSYTINNAVADAYKFSVQATDNKGLPGSSPGVLVFVIAGPSNKAPLVNITSPANNADYPEVATIDLQATASDADGTITSVQFYNGSTLLKTDSTSPYSHTITQLLTGNYSFVARAIDNNNLTNNSATVSVKVAGTSNKAPTIDLTVPSNNAIYLSPANITLNAAASDLDGTITRVQFFNGATLLKTDSFAPYSHIINKATAGNYKFYAKAIDNNGLANSSATVSAFVVRPSANKAPVVNITNPGNNANYTAPASFTINADANDSGGSITSVQFYNGEALLATDSTSPYSCTINNLAAGNYSFVAKAIDNTILTNNSATINVSVVVPPNKAPVIDIISPKNNATYTAPAVITLNAVAGDSDGTVTNVKFYNGSTLLKTVSKSPYNHTVTNIAEGKYKFFAKVTDNRGLSNSSATIYTVVTAALLVTLKPQAKSSPGPTVEEKTDLNDAVSLKLVPNPAHSILNIYTSGLQRNKQTTISVISASGAIIKTMQSSGSGQSIKFNIISLANGLYTVKLINGDKILYKKFVKL